MNEAPNSLEAILSALRPQEVSPGLRHRVSERLGDSPANQRRRPWRVALVGGLVAACLLVVLYRWGGDRGIERRLINVMRAARASRRRRGLEVHARGVPAPLAHSPEDLDALLAKDALVAPESNSELVGISAFTRSDVAIHALLGDH